MKTLRYLFCFVLLLCFCAVPAVAATSEELIASADVHLTFDDGIRDVTGKYTVSSSMGDTPLVEGKFGQAANCQAGKNYMTVQGLAFGTNSFTVSAWVRQNAIGGDPALFGNKDWMGGENPGFVFCARNNDWVLNMSIPGGPRTDCIYLYDGAPDVTDTKEWNHILITVDRDAQVASFYVNGQLYKALYNNEDFSERGYADISFDTAYPFNIGEDGVGTVNAAQTYNVDFDEVTVFLRALSAEEALAVYNYEPSETGTVVPAETEPPVTEPPVTEPPVTEAPQNTTPVVVPPKTVDLGVVVAAVAAVSIVGIVLTKKKH